MSTQFYAGGVVRPASEAPQAVLETIAKTQVDREVRPLSGRTRRNQQRQRAQLRRERGIVGVELDLSTIDVEGQLPGDPFLMRVNSSGVAYEIDDRAKATERKRRRCRAELQAAIASGEPIPEELKLRAIALLKKGRFANRQYVAPNDMLLVLTPLGVKTAIAIHAAE